MKFNSLSIRWKLVLIVLAITAATVLLSAGAFVYNDLTIFKQDLKKNIKTLASAIGANSRASLVFLDPDAGEKILLSLRYEHQVITAGLYDADDRIFAIYTPNELTPYRPPTTLEAGQYFYENYFESIHDIFLDGEKVGKIYLAADLAEFNNRTIYYAWIVIAILVGTILFSMALAIKLQSIISKPILSLSQSFKHISATSDYSIRVNTNSQDELGTLYSGFNDMLEQIDTREEELGKYRRQLEQKVVECDLAGQELKQSEETTRTILDNAFDAIITMTDDGLVQTWNHRAATLFGWHANEIVGKKLKDFIIPPQWREAHSRGMERFRSTGEGVVLNKQIELTGIRRDGSEFPIELAISNIKRNNNHLFIGIIRDITDRKRFEENLLKTQAQLRNFGQRLQSAREEEKTHIAREIHDELGQILTALKIDLSWIKKNLKSPDTLVMEKLTTMSCLIENTIQVVQRISSELRPQILDILGIYEALNWLANEFQKRNEIPCNLAVEPSPMSLPPNLSITIFRVFQEALTNIARHAEASKVEAVFKVTTDQCTLKVVDNGKGMDVLKTESSLSLGLMGIRERVLAWEGTMNITSHPGEGTTISIAIPLKTEGPK